MNGLESHNAAAARSGDHCPIGTRQIRNDHQAFESLLVVVFASLAGQSPDSSERTRAAFSEVTRILRRYAAYLLARWGIPSSCATADDVVQELYVRLLRRNIIGSYDQTLSLRKTYLFGIIRKILAETFRKMKPGRTVPLPADLLDPTPHPDEAAALHEIRDEVSSAIGRLRPTLADTIRSQYGMEQDTGGHSELTASARYTRASRARQALRRDLWRLKDP
jgi:RNA polymerase sigma factor (sigma-70 family)